METNSKTNEFKCPSCGAPLAFDPTNEVLKCSYCGYEDKIEGTVGVSENDFSSDDFQQEVWSNVFVVHCQSCGADNVLDNHDLSIKCPFCGSNQVIKSSEIPGIKPDRVLPFKVNSKDTLIGYQNWLKKKPFCPKKVKQDIPKAMISGVYLQIGRAHV